MTRRISLFVCAAILLSLLFACSPEEPPAPRVAELDLREWFAEGAKPEPLLDTLTPVDRPERLRESEWWKTPRWFWNESQNPSPPMELGEDVQYYIHQMLEYNGSVYALIQRYAEDTSLGYSVMRYALERGEWDIVYDYNNDAWWSALGLYAYTGRLLWAFAEHHTEHSHTLLLTEYDIDSGQIVNESRSLHDGVGSFYGYGHQVFWTETLYTRDKYGNILHDQTHYKLHEYDLDTREMSVIADGKDSIVLCEPYILYNETVRYGNKAFQHIGVLNLDAGETAVYTSDELPLGKWLFPQTVYDLTERTIHNGTVTYPVHSLAGQEDGDSGPYTDILTKDLMTKALLRSIRVPGITIDILCGEDWLAWRTVTGAFLYDGNAVRLLYEQENSPNAYGRNMQKRDGYLYFSAYRPDGFFDRNFVDAYVDVENQTVYYYDWRASE